MVLWGSHARGQHRTQKQQADDIKCVVPDNALEIRGLTQAQKNIPGCRSLRTRQIVLTLKTQELALCSFESAVVPAALEQRTRHVQPVDMRPIWHMRSQRQTPAVPQQRQVVGGSVVTDQQIGAIQCFGKAPQ